MCYQDTYADDMYPTTNATNACTGSQLALGCRPVGNPNLTLVAMDDRADVLFDCNQDTTCVHDGGNGVGWYFDENYSWGFAPAGEPVDRNSCDFQPPTFPELRLCWHTNDYWSNGYRCGDNDLNNDAGWERIIYELP